MVAFLFLVGTIGYVLLLDISAIQALYMTVITVSTVGFQEVAPLNDQARVFTIFIILWGIGAVGYAFSGLAIYFIDGEFTNFWRKRMINRALNSTNSHYIICGAGETAEVIIDQFKKDNVTFIVIDKDEEVYRNQLKHQVLAVHGDAMEEEILLEAHIKKAKGLISVLPDDASNIMTVLTARNLNPDLFIIARAIDHNSPAKLEKVGADHTLSLNEIGGRRMAAMMLRPNVVDFLDIITKIGSVELNLQEAMVEKNSELEGLTLQEAQIPQKIGLIILAIRPVGEKRMIFNPGPTRKFETGDVLVVLATDEQVMKLDQMGRGNV